MTDLVVHPHAAPLVGSVPVPSDKSIGHRALLFGALCEGETRIRGYAGGADNESTAGALRAMGVDIARSDAVIRGNAELVVRGAGLFGLGGG